MRHTVRFHGALADRFGAEFVLSVSSVSEAVHALCLQIRGLREEIKAGFFGVLVNGKSICKEALQMMLPKTDAVIDIIPVPAGSGGNTAGTVKTALGAVMIIVGIVLACFVVTAPFGYPLIFNGVVMMGAGIASFFMPAAQTDLSKFETPDKRQSFLFNGAVNSSTQGSAIPLVYGRCRVGSVVASAGIETLEVS